MLWWTQLQLHDGSIGERGERWGGAVVDRRLLQAHPRTTSQKQGYWCVAVGHQHHGDSQTEAALFNVNIDWKGQQSLSRAYSRSRSFVFFRYLVIFLWKRKHSGSALTEVLRCSSKVKAVIDAGFAGPPAAGCQNPWSHTCFSWELGRTPLHWNLLGAGREHNRVRDTGHRQGLCSNEMLSSCPILLLKGLKHPSRKQVLSSFIKKGHQGSMSHTRRILY